MGQVPVVTGINYVLPAQPTSNRSVNSVVAMPSISIEPHSISHPQQQAPHKRSQPNSETSLIPSPRDRAPCDSKRKRICWNDAAGLWLSNTNPSETKITRAVQLPKTSMNSKESQHKPARANEWEITPAEDTVPPAPECKKRRSPRKRTATDFFVGSSSLLLPAPKGRPPHASYGKSMVWDAVVGLWRSNRNSLKTKIPRAYKLPKLSSISLEEEQKVTEPDQVMHWGITAPEPPTSNAVVPDFNLGCATESNRLSPNSSPLFTPQPRGRPPHDSKGKPMSWDNAAGLWRSNRNPLETKDSKAAQLRKSSTVSQNVLHVSTASQDIRAQLLPMETTDDFDEEDGIIARPKGRSPLDSIGRTMKWDVEFGVWRSLYVEGETKYPKSCLNTTEVAALGDSHAPSMTSTPADVKPKVEEELVVKEELEIKEEKCEVPKAPYDSAGTGEAWYGVEAMDKSNVDVSNYSGRHVIDSDDRQDVKIEEEKVDVSDEISVRLNECMGEGIDARTTTQPRGRLPNDSAGRMMQWDGINGVWKSLFVEGETRATKSKMLKAEDGEKSTGIVCESIWDGPDDTAGIQKPNGTSSKGKVRKLMEWDVINAERSNRNGEKVNS